MQATNHFAWLLVAIAAIVVGGQYLARGDQPSEPVPAPAETIALIDIAQVFKESEHFRHDIEQMKADVADAEKELRDDRDAIKELSEDLTSTVDQIARARLEAEVIERQSRLKVKVDVQKNAFMQREATIYAVNYRQIERHVQRYAAEHKIRLVLRYNPQTIPDHDREKILAGVNRAIVFQENLDITAAIIKRVNAPQEDA